MEKKIRQFTDLLVWQRAHKLALNIYKASASFPKTEVFGLTSQIRRASLSITSNIAEGFGRHNNGEKIQFYNMANGSLTEVQNQLLFSKDLNYLSDNVFNELLNQTMEVKKMLFGLSKSIGR